jgi:hypothetical protein
VAVGETKQNERGETIVTVANVDAGYRQLSSR